MTFWNDFLPTMRFWYFFMHLYRRNQCLESETQIRKMVVKQWGWCDQNLYIKKKCFFQKKKKTSFSKLFRLPWWNKSDLDRKKRSPPFLFDVFCRCSRLLRDTQWSYAATTSSSSGFRGWSLSTTYKIHKLTPCRRFQSSGLEMAIWWFGKGSSLSKWPFLKSIC